MVQWDREELPCPGLASLPSDNSSFSSYLFACGGTRGNPATKENRAGVSNSSRLGGAVHLRKRMLRKAEWRATQGRPRAKPGVRRLTSFSVSCFLKHEMNPFRWHFVIWEFRIVLNISLILLWGSSLSHLLNTALSWESKCKNRKWLRAGRGQRRAVRGASAPSNLILVICRVFDRQHAAQQCIQRKTASFLLQIISYCRGRESSRGSGLPL